MPKLTQNLIFCLPPSIIILSIKLPVQLTRVGLLVVVELWTSSDLSVVLVTKYIVLVTEYVVLVTKYVVLVTEYIVLVTAK